MLMRHCKTEDSAYRAYFDLISQYEALKRQTIQIFTLDGRRNGTFLIKDYGNGLPHTLEAFSIQGHDGVYLRSLYTGGLICTIGYFSTLEDITLHVQKTLRPDKPT